MLRYAMAQYHTTLSNVLKTALNDSELVSKTFILDAKAKNTISDNLLGQYLYRITPRGLPLSSGMRDYLIRDARAMLLSYLKKREKGDTEVQPPTLPTLTPPTDDDVAQAMADFGQRIEFPLNPRQTEIIGKEQHKGRTRVAARLEAIYKSRAITKAAGQMLRSTEIRLPHPLEFTRPELARGFVLAKRHGNYYLLVKLFSKTSRYRNKSYVLFSDFVDVRTGEDLGGKTYPGIVLPLELGRDHQDAEFIRNGKPQSAKLLVTRSTEGTEEFYVNIAFEFSPTPIVTESFFGLDRGAAMIGAATVINSQGQMRERLNLHGVAFADEMRLHQRRVAEAQRDGKRAFNFRLRGRRAKIILGEYANKLITKAIEHKSQIVLEKLDAKIFSRHFLKQSQIRKLHDMLTYKAERAGLPAPIEVPAAYTSQTCARCGHHDPANRPHVDADGRAIQHLFRCTGCGYTANAQREC